MKMSNAKKKAVGLIQYFCEASVINSFKIYNIFPAMEVG